jgi:hypothetical protein
VYTAIFGRTAHLTLSSEAAKRQWTPPPGYDWTKDHSDFGKYPEKNANVAPAAAAPASSAPAQAYVPATTAAAAPASSGSSNSDDSSNSNPLEVGADILGDISKFVVKTATKIGTTGRNVLAGANPTSKCEFAWLGNDGDYVNTLTNDANEEITVLVWDKNSTPKLGDAQYMDKHAPAITVKIPAGSSVPVSMAHGASGGFTAVYSDTIWSDITWLLTSTIGEFTAQGGDTTFDVSREWFMDGHGMTIEAGDCKSSTVNNECAFYCKSGQTCGESGTYELNQSSSSNCNRAMVDFGFGSNPEGGCRVDSSSHKSVKTSFH